MIRRMMTWAKHHRWSFVASLLLTVATVVAGMGLMGTSGYLISRAAQRPLITDLFMVTAAVRFFGISRAVVRYFERLLSHDLTFRILGTIRTTLYRALDARPLSWMMGQRPGDLLGRLVADVETLQNAYLRIIIPAMAALLIMSISTFLLWLVNPLMALVALAFLLGSGLAIPLLAVSMARGSGQAETATRAAMKVFLVDKIQGMQDVLWLGQEGAMRRQFADQQKQIDRLQRQHAGRSGLLEGINTILSHSGAVATLLLAIPMVLSGELKGVMLATLTLAVLSSFEAVQGLGHAFLQYGHAAASAKRVFSISEAHAESGVGDKPVTDTSHGVAAIRNGRSEASEQRHVAVRQDVQADKAGSLSGGHPNYDIVFDHVSFAYEPGATVISDLSLKIPEGTKLAIIGPTGSGKTTIASLLLRFWDVDQGNISLGGIDIRSWDIDVLRSSISVLSQDAYIFQRSLRDNLLLARLDASDDELAGVLESLGLGGFSGLLDMIPGSHGMRLSGGERQLRALARALLNDAPIFLFDEATAHLDVATEKRVLDTIFRTVKSRTQIMITHREAVAGRMAAVFSMNRER